MTRGKGRGEEFGGGEMDVWVGEDGRRGFWGRRRWGRMQGKGKDGWKQWQAKKDEGIVSRRK